MNSEGANSLAYAIGNADIFILILVRVIGLFSIVPVIGGNSIPARIRLGFSLLLAGIIYSSGNAAEIFYDDSVIGFGILIAKEFFVGWIIGYFVYFIFNITYLSGHLIDQQIGLSMVSVFDPVSQIQVPVVGNLYYMSLCILFIISNAHHMIIKTLFYSYEVLPMGQAVIINNGELMSIFIGLIVKFLYLGVTIAVPIIGIILVVDLILGLLVRTVPKMNVFVVGMPLKIFIGLFGIWLVAPLFGNVYSFLYDEISKALLNIIKVMMP